jgi:amino acid transporter
MQPSQLRPHIGAFTLLAAAISGIIGSGWLLSPLVCAKIAGPASVVSWLIGGILMAVVASTFVLLTRLKPIVGGTVRYFQLTYGHFVGFAFSWIAWLAWIAVSPIETMAMVQYASSYLPSLMTTGSSPILSMKGIGLAIGCMLFFTTMNCFGIRLFSKANALGLAFKLIIPLATVFCMIPHHFHSENFHAQGGFMPFGFKSVFSCLPLAGVIYSFIGFNPAIQMAYESLNPRKHVPLAVFGALGICSVIYASVQIAFIGGLPTQSLSHGWHAISYMGDTAPFVGLLTAFGFTWFVKVLLLDAIVSPLTTAMVQSMATGRLTFAMCENGYLPKCLTDVNRYGAPYKAIIINMCIGFCFLLPFPSWQRMVGFLVSCLVLGYIVGPLALVAMYQPSSQHWSKVKRAGIWLLCMVAFTICNLMIFWSGWNVLNKMLLLFLVGYIFLFIKNQMSTHTRFITKADVFKGSWMIIYGIGMGLISYFGSFGGKGIIPFGLDFMMISIWSVIIFLMAYFFQSRKA